MLVPIAKSNVILQYLAKTSLMIYPLIAHMAIMLDQVVWAAGYLMVVVCLNSFQFFSRHRYLGIIFTLLLCSGMAYSFYYSNIDIWIIYFPPVLIPAWLAYVFIKSMQNEYALISQIAKRIEGKQLDQRHLNYTRVLTALWGVVFILMVCEAIMLAIWAPFYIWSWWVHIGNYLVVGMLFLIEIFTRRLFIGRRVKVVQMFKVLLKRNWHEFRN